MNFLRNLKAMVTPGNSGEPAACFERLRGGKAVLIDVREPAEWEKGVARTANLLPLSDLRGGRDLWKSFLKKTAGRELVIYCAAGARAGMAARILEAEGHAAVNAGGIGGWASAGWEIVAPDEGRP